MARRLTSPTFVGRGTELAVLDVALERAAGERPSAVFIGGESGVGKTRLLQEFEARAREQGACVLHGQCLELGGVHIPYAPLVSALRPVTRDGARALRDLPPATLEALAGLLPELAEGTAPGELGEDEQAARQGRLYEALLALLSRLGREQPLILAIEDLHWADSATRDFITFLVRSAREEPLCLVVTYRSDELHRRHPLRPLLAELERAAGVERLGLERFDRDEVAEQLAGILQQEPPSELADRLYRRSQGNALYTEELLAASEDGAGWLLPDTLRDALLTRVERLSPAGQAVTRAAAVLDRPITHAMLEAVCGLPAADVMEGAREAVAQQVLVPDADGRYWFRHALVGEAIHGDLLPGEDTALHARIAAALEADPELLGDVTASDVAAELACHWRAAHDLGRGLAASVRAGRAAKRVYAYEEAGRQFERALELWPRVPDADELAGIDQVEVLRLAAACASGRGAEQRAVALIREALALLDEQAEPLRAAALYERLGGNLRAAGLGDESFAAFDRALALLPPEPSHERARVLQTRAVVLMVRDQWEAAAADARRALDEARAVGAEATELNALNTLGFALNGLGETEKGIAKLREALDRAIALGSPGDRVRATTNLSEALDFAGRSEEGLAVVRAELTAAGRDRPEERSSDAFLALQEVQMLIRLGRLDEARRRVPQRVPGDAISYSVQFWRDHRAALAMHDGDLDGLRTELCAIESNAESMREPQWMEPYATMEAELALRTDAMDEARTVLRRAAELIVRSEYTTRLLRLAAHAERVEAEAAGRARALGEPYVPLLDEAIAALLARAESRPLPRPAEADAWALVARAERARRAFLLGEGTAGPAEFEAAAAAFDALSLPVYAVYCRYRAAEAHVTAGDRVAAGAVLREAAAGAEATGSRLLAADVDGLARRARIDLADPAGHDAAAEHDDSPAARLGLTPRELEVLQLVALGHTNRAIGEALFMSEKTASVHVSRILGKLGVGGRVEAAAIAHRLGITSVSAAR